MVILSTYLQPGLLRSASELPGERPANSAAGRRLRHERASSSLPQRLAAAFMVWNPRPSARLLPKRIVQFDRHVGTLDTAPLF